jgi:hypothetical protein
VVKVIYVLNFAKMFWATFGAISLQAHPVTLDPTHPASGIFFFSDLRRIWKNWKKFLLRHHLHNFANKKSRVL